MENMGRKAAILAAAVTAVGALGAGYYYRNDIIYKICDIVHPEWNEGEARLTDDLDRRCSLLNNGDGTETVLYDNDNYERNKSRRIKDISKQSGFGRAGIRSSSGAS